MGSCMDKENKFIKIAMAHQYGEVKSIHSDTPVNAVFTNKTERNVDLFWIDFNGQCVRYQNGLKHAQRFDVNTYETHPWVAKDNKTGASLLIKNDFIYFPKASEDNDVQHVQITIPVYRLVDRCMDVLRSAGVNRSADKLEIPASLKRELKVSLIPPYRDYD